jgi:3-oxocholest-4-en-26-oyl-CoA dehydrogenase alpha subunit
MVARAFRAKAIVRVGEDTVELGLTPEQQELKDQLRAYFVRLVEEVEASHHEESTYTHYIRRMGEDGWLGLGWPTEYGGQARGPIDQMIFVEESHWAGVPLPLLTLNSVGPTLMALGTDEQKRRLLPGILQGKVHFSIGYTEPSAGTDLASLKTRAVRDGDEYVIDGQKVFTSAIQYADYIWLAARTDPEAPKHKGLSVFIVPVDTPGFSWAPLPTIAGDITSSTFYEGVRVPAENLVGEENQGWKLITNQLNHERVAICPASGLLRSLNDVRRWAQEHKLGDGRRVIDQEWVQLLLARVHAKIEVLKLLNWKVAWAADKGLNPADASATKVYGTELALEVYSLLGEVVGQAGYLAEGSAAAVLQGRLERQARGQTIFTFGGGTNEIQRDIIAMVGLGMPRAPR